MCSTQSSESRDSVPVAETSALPQDKKAELRIRLPNGQVSQTHDTKQVGLHVAVLSFSHTIPHNICVELHEDLALEQRGKTALEQKQRGKLKELYF
jgi:hypothetical protein